MKTCKIEDLHEGAILAQDVITNDYQVLLGVDTVLKQEYIQKLKELGVREVRVREEKSEEVPVSILREEVEQIFRNKVKSVLENHMYQHNQELVELSKTADVIIMEILEDDNVIERVYDIKERNADIYEHSISLCTLATIMGLKYKLDRDVIHDIGVACLLHDLGLRYVTVPYENMNMTELSEMEYTEYKKHPIYAYNSLEKEEWISERCKNMILMHHERMDGSGYPLHASTIPRETQIVEVCDIFDEMICGIGCVRTTVYEAIEYLKSKAGICFAKDVVATLLHFVAAYPVGTKIMTNEGEIGIVLRQNHEYPERPVVRIIQDKNGNTVNENLIRNLVEEKSVFVEKTMDR